MKRRVLGILLAVIVVAGAAIGVYAYTRTDNSWYAEYGDISVSEGVVIYLGVRGYDAGYALAEDKSSGFWSAKIEGTASTKWVADYTAGALERYLTVEALFDDLGLELTDGDLEEIGDTVYEEYWYYGRRAIYGPMGVHEEDFTDIITNNKKAEMLLDHYRDELSATISDGDLREVLAENYAAFIYISMSYFDEEGESWRDYYDELCRQIEDGEITVAEMAEQYAGEPGFSSSYHAEDGRHDTAIASTNSRFPAAFREELFAAGDGDVIFYDDSANYNYNIVQRTALLADDYFVELLRDELLQILLEDKFEALLAGETDNFKLSVNSRAIERLDMQAIMAQA